MPFQLIFTTVDWANPLRKLWYDMIWYDMIWYDMIWYDMIYLSTAVGLTSGGSSTVHIYTQSIHRTTQIQKYIEQQKYQQNNTNNN